MPGRKFIQGFTNFLIKYLDDSSSKNLRDVDLWTKKKFTTLAFEQIREQIEAVHGDRIFKAMATQVADIDLVLSDYLELNPTW